jgi:hypothetical protein
MHMSDHNDPTQSGALPSVSLQPVVGSEIGSMDWGACMDCKHDIRGGGCAVDPTAFKNKIMFNMDSVYCGCFESRYADRPNPSRQPRESASVGLDGVVGRPDDLTKNGQ